MENERLIEEKIKNDVDRIAYESDILTVTEDNLIYKGSYK